jgi:hypothetical protein
MQTGIIFVPQALRLKPCAKVMEQRSAAGVLFAANVTEDQHMDHRDYDPATGRPVGYDPVTDPYAPRRSSSALWGLLIAAIVAVAAVMFMYNSGNRDRTATNPPATTAERSNVPPSGMAPGRSTTGQSTGDLNGGAGAPTPPAPSTAR